ncbi:MULTISPECIES: toxin-antitoxin system HicB family antitoxin [unclassified Acidovorax]|uniref:toxin-antitoxin system HicB family antitoxin n=1 Tax=unclassified Acidovorax TaxID=2684926 RepID=UPI001C43E4F7|nr:MULTISPECIES: toxin-antitoxin system HicB family antitoxin [unclassified Acidovorax]MBV7428086.1 toxin-antitoxin system HicB family antitoxin [Acidovorax sp. sif0732]MBV7449343.1 toxin-antitoxin system HicB family antitoxin [Acidovorax sp. sif0715]
MDEEDRYTRITLRIPKDLHQVLVAAAERTSKSLNAEIVGRLQESIPDDSEARAFAVLPERSSIRDDLVDSIRQLSALRSEKAVYELRLDMAAATGQPVSGLKELYAQLRLVKHEIERCERHIEEFKAEAIEAYGLAPDAKAVDEPGSKPMRPKKPKS